MDDELEFKEDRTEEDEFNDGLQDWSVLAQGSKVSAIPKRGDKGFEPTSNYDQLMLEKKRSVMYATIINSKRGTFHKNKIDAFWLDDVDRAVVHKPKGAMFNNIGAKASKNQAFLTYEEILYLVERGNIECWTTNGVPMTLQMCYALFLKSSMDYDNFYAYSYLKRYGYIVKRSTPQEQVSRSAVRKSLTDIIFGRFGNLSYIFPRLSWSTFYSTILLVTYRPLIPQLQPSKYKIYFDIWKPSHKGKFEDPDFQLIVVDTNKFNLPTLQEIQSIYYTAINKHKIIIAIVDNGMMNFIKLCESDIAKNNIFIKNLTKKPRVRGPRRRAV